MSTTIIVACDFKLLDLREARDVFEFLAHLTRFRELLGDIRPGGFLRRGLQSGDDLLV
ncbi:MAG: hypothetical protein ABI362_04550 [Chthoniobacterales bacterium]